MFHVSLHESYSVRFKGKHHGAVSSPISSIQSLIFEKKALIASKVER